MNKRLLLRNWIALIVLLLNVVIVAYFWSVLGQNYTPVNDDWVSVSKFEQAAPQGAEEREELDSRVVRTIPFVLHSKIESVGFTTLNAFLVTINILTGLGLFLLIDRFIPDKALFSAISSLLIMYFPYDGTMFWMGAFGVNLGYLLCLYSLYFFICSIEQSSKARFWLAILLLLASGRSYPGYLPVQVFAFALYLYTKKDQWRVWWDKAGIFAFVCGIGFVQFALNASSGHGREGHVANFELNEVWRGFVHAFRQLYAEAYGKLFEAHPIHWAILFIMAVVAVGLYWINRSTSGVAEVKQDSGREYKKIVVWLAVVAPLILLAGYAPYAFSDIRFGTDRQLLFARPGVVLLYVAIMFWLLYAIVRSVKLANVVIMTVGVAVIVLAVHAKTRLAEEYAAASQVERIFLGDLAVTMPEIKGAPTILIYYEDESVIVNNRAKIMLNRPNYLVQYLYGRNGMTVFGANESMLEKYGKSYRDGSLEIKGRIVSTDSLVVLAYNLKDGFRILDKLTLQVGTGQMKNIQLAKPKITNEPPTPRQRWFINERDRLVKSLSLREATSI